MKKLAAFLLMAVVACLLAPAAFAQGGEAVKGAGVHWIAVATAAGMGLAAAVCGIAQSRVAAAACEGIARNPAATDAIRGAMILGLVFIETLVLFTLAMIYLKAA
jgi:F-type H+-transporting ATPase subunit c